MNFAKLPILDTEISDSARAATLDSLTAPKPQSVAEVIVPSPLSRLSTQPSLKPADGSESGSCAHPAGRLSPLFSAKDFITGKAFEVAVCSECDMSLTSPMPPSSEMPNYYPSGYYGALADRRFPAPVERLQRALYASRVRKVEKLSGKKAGRVLDIGCGRGLLLNEFRRQGWQVQGTELSEEAARYPREVLNLPVKTGRIEDIKFPAGQFDAITLWHVLEHVPDPRATLAEINRILKPGGALLVSVPNFGGIEARVARDKWFHLDVPRHVSHFSRDMLQRLLEDTGFADKTWTGFAPEYDAFSFMQSALNRCGLRHNLLYDWLRGKSAKVIESGRAPLWQILASFVLGAGFGILALVFTFVAGLFCQGGTITVVAVKSSEAPAKSKLARSFLRFIPKESELAQSAPSNRGPVEMKQGAQPIPSAPR